MGFSAVKDAFYDRWKTLIELGGDGGAATFTVYPRSGRTEPASGPWARVSIRFGPRERADFGSSTVRRREVGVFYVEFMVEKETGERALDTFGDRVKAAFESKGFGGVVTHDLSRHNAGRDDADENDELGRWAREVFSLPFFYDDVS